MHAYTEDHPPRDEKNRDCERIYTHVTSLRFVSCSLYGSQQLFTKTAVLILVSVYVDLLVLVPDDCSATVDRLVTNLFLYVQSRRGYGHQPTGWLFVSPPRKQIPSLVKPSHLRSWSNACRVFLASPQSKQFRQSHTDISLSLHLHFACA